MTDKNRNGHVLLFAGTKEGRELAEYLNEKCIPTMVCVATEYGEELIQEMPYVQVRTGRMNLEEMKEFMKECKPLAVVDATHPYADIVTKNIQEACTKTENKYLRLLRGAANLEVIPGLQLFTDTLSAAKWLDQKEGNILLTTGIKELPVFAEQITNKDRIYARVLLQDLVFQEMERYNLSKKQMICMQGPFSKEMNVATLHMTEARYLVTKESGSVGGFMEKVEAAKEAGAICVVIQRPVKETGLSAEEVQEQILELWNLTKLGEKVCEAFELELEQEEENWNGREITLLGIGMGDPDNMTVEARLACQDADCIIGAKRMLDTVKQFGKPMANLYLSNEILNFIREHKEYKKIVIALSGDVGFYSGAKKLVDQLNADGERYRFRELCGISSVVYFASKIHMPWEDMTLVSTHGRQQNLIGAVMANRKVFSLASNAESICEIATKLCDYGLAEVDMYVGVNLSYPKEKIFGGKARDFVKFAEPGMCVCVMVNEQASNRIVTHGLPDELFIRGKAPMTKEEVRSISISKLHLNRDSIVYDVGAGTGSVSIECARVTDQGKVYAVEWKEDAWKLIARNRTQFGVANLEIVPGRAPEALMDLPAPTHAFIGGSSGNMKEILRLLRKKNPGIRIVINCITLETVAESLEAAKDQKFEILDIASVSVAKSKTVGEYHMMMGQNPVYVITLGGYEE